MRLNLFLALLIGLNFFISVNATTPEEYCAIHYDSGAPGDCVEDPPACVRLVSNLGTEDCKKCAPGGCELVDCEECENQTEGVEE